MNRHRHPCQSQVQSRLVESIGIAEIALYRIAKKVEILDRKRPIQSHRRSQLFSLCLRSVQREQIHSRISSHVKKNKDNHGNNNHDRYHL